MRIIYNANIYTLDPKHPVARAFAIDRERILAVGDDDLIRSSFSWKEDELDAGNATLIPGLTDAHIHLQQYALSLNIIDCETTTRADCLARIADRAQNSPAGDWIIGHGWNQNNWPDGVGSRADLDQAVPDHPVYLTAKSLHATWVNSEALRQAGIGANTPDPPGGRIGRDEDGLPDGFLYESAMQLVAIAIPEPPPNQILEAIQNTQFKLTKMGVTSVHDFDRRSCLSALQILHERGELNIRIVKSIPIDDLTSAIEMGIHTGFGDDFLRIGGVKIFADGALGPRTAAMLEPYTGEPANSGILVLDSDALYEQGRRAIKNRISLCIHAIGDLANREVLNALGKLRTDEIDVSRQSQLPLLRHRIEHVQLIHPDDTRRLAQLKVIASMQPEHATSDMHMADQYWGTRTANAYAWRTQLDNGATLAFGSDAPVESPNPFRGLFAAVTRRRPDGSPGQAGWHPEQKLNISEALHAYCTGPAYAAGNENRLGMLSPGYLADLLLLDTDVFNCEPEQILEIRPLATMVAGEWVYQR